MKKKKNRLLTYFSLVVKLAFVALDNYPGTCKWDDWVVLKIDRAARPPVFCRPETFFLSLGQSSWMQIFGSRPPERSIYKEESFPEKF